MHPLGRRASRLIVVDVSGRVLLFQFEDERGHWWASPGGGLEGIETFEQAATREAAEELGLIRPELELLWESTVEFTSSGTLLRQTERYFLIRTTISDLATGDQVRAAHYRDGIMATRWWPLDELAVTTERVFPVDLAERLKGLLSEMADDTSGFAC